MKTTLLTEGEAKAAVDKEWDNSKKLPAWRESKIFFYEVIEQAQKEGKTVHSVTPVDLIVSS